MWPRTLEVMIGLWLLMSPFIFGHSPADRDRWVIDLGGGALVIVLSLLSFWHRTWRAHLLIPVVATGLVGVGYFSAPHPLPAALQNHILVGLLLLMVSILPTEITAAPRSWRQMEY